MNRLHVNPEKCIACGKCYLNYPKVFDCDDEGIAFIIKNSSPQEQLESERAIFDCPTRAIERLDQEQAVD